MTKSPSSIPFFRIDDVTWDKDKILVLNEVTIEPPYRPDTIRAKEDSKALKYIKQIVSWWLFLTIKLNHRDNS